MFTGSIFLISLLLSSTALAELSHELKPSLGKPAPANFESVVTLDGTGAPQGSGSVSTGKVIYEAQCASCHALDGKMQGNAIAGGMGSLATPRPIKTVGSYWPYATTLFDYINRAMPYGMEKSLTADEVYAVTAYVLFLNDVLEVGATLDNENLSQVIMPNRDGFRTAPNFEPTP